MCNQLVKATLHLHGLDLQHGDLHPGNVLIEGEDVRFIDAIDMVQGGAAGPHNPAYAPVDHESVSPEQRDCYAVAKMCGELLERVSSWDGTDAGPLRGEIQRCLDRELRVHALDRIDDALARLLHPPLLDTGPRLVVQMRQLTSRTPLAGDNGEFHVGVAIERVRNSRQQPQVEVSLSGVRRRLLLLLKPTTLDFASLRVRDMPHSQFVRMATQAAATLKAEILFEPAPADDASDLLAALEAIAEVRQAIDAVRAQILGLDAPEEEVDVDEEGPAGVPRAAPRTEALWQAILDAEEATLPEVEIAAPVAREMGRRDKLRIPSQGGRGAIESDAKVEALQEINGELVKVGDIDMRETTQAILVIDNPRIRIQTGVGDRIKLRSQQDLSSFRRRHLAVTRILGRESVLPDLIDYFDPVQCPLPQALQAPPTDAELDAYDRHNESGQVVFYLNRQQRDAFAKLWSQGPLSLLQGPPGTGKTSFIASFIHYAMSHGAQSILLAPVARAVNNAAEKVIELCQRTDLPLDVVRFGAEGMVSEQLRPHHSASILQAYRDLFRSEMRQRVVALSRNLGLPNAFVETWFDIDFHLGRLLRDIERLARKLSEATATGEDLASAAARVGQRTERLRTLAREKFGVLDVAEPANDCPATKRRDGGPGVTSADAVSKLDQVMAMAQKVDRLGAARQFRVFARRGPWCAAPAWDWGAPSSGWPQLL
jgi:hypothetical protein